MTSSFDQAWINANEYIEDKPHLCLIENLETGYPELITVEDRAIMLGIFEESMRPLVLTKEQQKKIQYFGTGGQIEIDKIFIDLFKNDRTTEGQSE